MDPDLRKHADPSNKQMINNLLFKSSFHFFLLKISNSATNNMERMLLLAVWLSLLRKVVTIWLEGF
ncbi:MAG: hypothetical protein DI535_08150 [Citrobacter freundii]|nr:MAG: hypothetical protein DI535_08150 [Citrobacter freundii]